MDTPTGRHVPAGLRSPIPCHAISPGPLFPTRYRKVVSDVCEGGVDLQRGPGPLQCPLTPPRGLRVSIRGEAVAMRPGEDVLFVVQQEQVSGQRTRHGAARGSGDHAVWVITLESSPWSRRGDLGQSPPGCPPGPGGEQSRSGSGPRRAQGLRVGGRSPRRASQARLLCTGLGSKMYSFMGVIKKCKPLIILQI